MRVLCGLLYLLLLRLAWAVGGTSGSSVLNRDSLISNGRKSETRKQSTSQAYATLLYGDEFLLGVRVLGKSIRDTGATKDMVVLVSQGVTSDAVQLLEADGWIVERIELLANPNEHRPTRFWGVYTKLKIFNMTDYEKVLYLDADTVVLRDIEDLFECQKFCANLKHSERLNSGVMVVEPSEELFKDMLSKVPSTYSYTGGDQGFLNSYYEDFPNARVFDPLLSKDERKQYHPNFERLPTIYNADVGLYMLANKWMVDAKELRVVHYTLGPLKPWDWWTQWLLKPVDLWQNVRVTLEDSLPGTKGGQTRHMILAVRVLMLLPLIILAFSSRRLLCQIHQDICGLLCTGSPGICGYARQMWYKYSASTSLPIYSSMSGSPPNNSAHPQYVNGLGSGSGNSRLPAYLGSVSVVVCFASVLIAIITAGLLVPHQVMPWTGMLLAYEWTFFVFTMLFGKYLDIIYGYGKSSAVDFQQKDFQQYNSAKGHGRQTVLWDVETMFYGLGMALLSTAVPAMPFMLGVTSLFARLGLMVGMGLVLAAFMTYASEHLAIHWFLRGREEWNQVRPSSVCCGL